MPSFLKRLLGAVVILLALIALNMAMSAEGFYGFGVPLYLVDLCKMAAIGIILAVSLNLINGFTGQFSIGHIGFMAVGAYASAYMTVYHTLPWEQWLAGMVGPNVAAAIIFTFVILVGAVAAAIMGLIVGIPSLRLRGDYLAIATLGFAEIIRIIIVNINKIGAATGFRGCLINPDTGKCYNELTERMTIPGYTNFLWIGIFAVITIVVIYNIVNSDTGRALISIREDELAAQAMGVNTTRYKVTAFVISAAFAGVAGALYGHWRLPHPADFTFVRSFEIIIMIVLGGMGSITGSVLGAVVITILPEFLRTYPYEIVLLLVLIPITAIILRAVGRDRLPRFARDGVGYYGFVLVGYLVFFAVARIVLINLLSLDLLLQKVIGDISNYRLVIYSALLIGMMLARPQGVLGGRELSFNWLKRAQRRPEGDVAVGASRGVPIAERDAPTTDTAKEVENR